MLGALRSHAGGLFAKVLLGLLILSFAVWGIGDVFRGPGPGGDVAVVDGTAITPQHYERALNRGIEGFRRLLGDEYSPELLKNSGIYRQVLRGRIETLLLQKEAETLGLAVSDEEILLKIKGSPIFHGPNGAFSKTVFLDTLRVLGMSESEFVQDLKDQIQGRLIVDSVTQPAPVSEHLVRALYRIREEMRIADIVVLRRHSVGSIPDPETHVLEAYHARNAEKFTAPEYRTLSYITLTPRTLEKMNTVTEEEIKDAYARHREEFAIPEKREVEQLLYAERPQAEAAHAMLKAGSTLHRVAAETPILNRGATALGTITRSDAQKGMEQTIFSMKPGAFSAPLHSDFGWHIFQVRSVQDAAVPALSAIRGTLVARLMEERQEDSIYRLSNRLQDALASGLTLGETAKELGLDMRTVGPVDAAGWTPQGKKAAGIPPFENFLSTAFKLEEHAESSLTLSRQGSYFLVRVDRMAPEHLLPLSSVKDRVMRAWKEERILKRLSEKAEEVSDALRESGGKTRGIPGIDIVRTGKIRRHAEQLGHAALRQSKPPGALIETIFSLKPAQFGAPYKTEHNDIWIPVLRTIIPVHGGRMTEAAAAKLRRQIEKDITSELYTHYMYYLQSRYPVSVNEQALQAITRTP